MTTSWSELSPVDWKVARATARRSVPAGPKLSNAERADVVAGLRSAAAAAVEVVVDVTGLPEVGDVPELVVDRPTLIEANLETAETIFREVTARIDSSPSLWQRLSAPVSKRASGVAVGGLLAALSTRILGQFDPFGPRPRLLLNAPTVVAIERSLEVDPKDFRTWVALHEQVHRVQFSNAPWLRARLLDLMSQAVVADMTDEKEPGRLLRAAKEIIADESSDDVERATSLRVMAALNSPQITQILDDVSAVMSLLEGHADVMMDRAGKDVIPSVDRIRERFDKRRGKGGVAVVLAKLTGMDAKLAQYAEGAAFTRMVIDQIGVDGFNRVFSGPEFLPSMHEIQHPESYLERVREPGPDA